MKARDIILQKTEENYRLMTADEQKKYNEMTRSEKVKAGYGILNALDEFSQLKAEDIRIDRVAYRKWAGLTLKEYDITSDSLVKYLEKRVGKGIYRMTVGEICKAVSESELPPETSEDENFKEIIREFLTSTDCGYPADVDSALRNRVKLDVFETCYRLADLQLISIDNLHELILPVIKGDERREAVWDTIISDCEKYKPEIYATDFAIYGYLSKKLVEEECSNEISDEECIKTLIADTVTMLSA